MENLANSFMFLESYMSFKVLIESYDRKLKIGMLLHNTRLDIHAHIRTFLPNLEIYRRPKEFLNVCLQKQNKGTVNHLSLCKMKQWNWLFRSVFLSQNLHSLKSNLILYRVIGAISVKNAKKNRTLLARMSDSLWKGGDSRYI
ncbi:hypothetical protein L1987_73523 [Smallanthus sonchifolius]|uniref:Uncharacterized protein n=1 Tax=Smallanthus sonchifolius TaxID=185202 RepID=A0ACB9A0G2_9ASTR|nr:hypothetical protein L1987_73523 [Smallanthus sonchifolius]